MTLAYDRSGSGDPLLLVHGLGLSRAVWRPVVPLLEREREVIALDQPGFGASPRGPRTVEGLAAAVAAFAAELGLDRPHVAGNSLGGGIALALGAGGHARSVCAISPIGFASAPESAYARALLAASRGAARMLAPVAADLARPGVVRAALCAHLAARPRRIPPEEVGRWTRDAAAAAAFWDLWREGPGWRGAALPACPVTVAWGERDRLLLFGRQSRRARRALPAARHVVLRGCGHVPMWDDPAQVAAVILGASS